MFFTAFPNNSLTISIDLLDILRVKDQLQNRQLDVCNLSFSKHFSSSSSVGKFLLGSEQRRPWGAFMLVNYNRFNFFLLFFFSTDKDVLAKSPLAFLPKCIPQPAYKSYLSSKSQYCYKKHGNAMLLLVVIGKKHHWWVRSVCYPA